MPVRWQSIFVLLALVFGSFHPLLWSRPSDESNLDKEREQAEKKILAQRPKDSDFHFDPPAGWDINLMKGARVVSISTNENLTDAARLINGILSTKWQSNRADLQPAITFDLGRTALFNRIVIFDRCTENLGTGDGNNATREIGLWVSVDPEARDFTPVGDFVLKGPLPFCVKVGQGQICTWIDNKNPTIIELKAIQARFVRVVLKRSFWEDHVKADLKKTIALSQILLFNAR